MECIIAFALALIYQPMLKVLSDKTGRELIFVGNCRQKWSAAFRFQCVMTHRPDARMRAQYSHQQISLVADGSTNQFIPFMHYQDM
jgi:hypothetical protein